MSEQSTNELPRDPASAAATVQPEAMTFQSEAINLLEVMEICSELCLAQPLTPCGKFWKNAPLPRPKLRFRRYICRDYVIKSFRGAADDWNKFIDQRGSNGQQENF